MSWRPRCGRSRRWRGLFASTRMLQASPSWRMLSSSCPLVTESACCVASMLTWINVCRRPRRRSNCGGQCSRRVRLGRIGLAWFIMRKKSLRGAVESAQSSASVCSLAPSLVAGEGCRAAAPATTIAGFSVLQSAGAPRSWGRRPGWRIESVARLGGLGH